MQALGPEFERRGYQQYRGKQYISISGGVLRKVAVYPDKNDAYVWYGAFPLCHYDLWLGWSAMGGRFPKRTGALKILSQDDVQPGIESLMRGVIKSVRILNRVRDTARFRDMLLEQESQYQRLALAYCHADVGEFAKARDCARRFLEDGRITTKTKIGAEALIEAVDDGEVPDLLRYATKDNVRRLRLSRYMP